jgi:hypothetical protein
MQPHHLCPGLRLRCTQFRRAFGAHFTLRQIENAYAVTRVDGLDEGATAGELRVIAVRGNREEIERAQVTQPAREMYVATRSAIC